MLCFLFKSTVRKDKTGSLGRSCSCLPRYCGLNRECGLVGTSTPLLTRSTCACSWGLEKAICKWGPRKDDMNPAQMCSARVHAPWSQQISLTKYKFKDNRTQVSRWQLKSSKPSRGRLSLPLQPAEGTWAGLPGGWGRTMRKEGGGNAMSTETPQPTWGCQAPRREGQVGTLRAASVQVDQPGVNRKLILILDELE